MLLNCSTTMRVSKSGMPVLEIDARFCLGLYRYMTMVRSNQWTAYSRVKGGIFHLGKEFPSP